MRRGRYILAVCTLFFACDEGVPNTLGLDEPIRVRNGQFIFGALPVGTAATPTITNVTVTSPTVLPEQAGKAINGRASGDASAIAMRFDDVGDGYWVVPMGPLDNQFPGELTWQAIGDYGPSAASHPGHHTLRFVPIDQNGVAGPPATIDLCFQPQIPDDNATCDPSATPPAAVLTLAWDDDADVDLVVVGPGGVVIDPKHPLTIPEDAGVVDPTAGKFDRDSLAGCVADGRRQEDLIWQNAPAAGTTFDVYASLFDACGQAPPNFVATLTEWPGGVATDVNGAKGTFTSWDANGGATSGTYLFSFSF